MDEYHEKDFRWERGFNRAPNGFLLGRFGVKYYKIPQGQEKRVRLENFLYWLITYALLVGMLTSRLWLDHRGSIVFCLFSLFFILLGSSVLSRGLEQVKVIEGTLMEKFSNMSNRIRPREWFLLAFIAFQGAILPPILIEQYNNALIALSLINASIGFFCIILGVYALRKKTNREP